MRTNWRPLPTTISPTARRLVEQLRACKDTSGMTLAQLGSATHYSRASWERWLNGKRLITPGAVTSLATALRIDAAPLLALLDRAETASSDGPETQRDPDLPDGPQAQGGPRTSRAAVAQLPADTRVFTGRDEELDKLLRLAEHAAGDAESGTVAVAAIDGMAGVGKSALAIHVAHRLRDRFPDGQLFIDLRGHTPGLRPLEPVEALGYLLRSLQVRPEAIPVDLDERAACYRSTLAGTRTLILLDNAANAAQVRPLIPGSAGSLVLITSRAVLASLDDAHLVSLDILPEPDAVTLFCATAGREHTRHNSVEVAELVELCGRLPLAIRIAAAHLRRHRSLTVADLVSRLREAGSRLDELAVADLAARASFRVSYEQLADDRPEPGTIAPARAFRLLGLAGTPDISLPAAAALFDVSADHAENVLEILVEVRLLESPVLGRYQFHDLIGLYARECAAREEIASDRDGAIDRLLHWYTETTHLAGNLVYPGRLALPLAPRTDSVRPLTFSTNDAVLAWYDRERVTVLATVAMAHAEAHYSYGWMLAAALWPLMLMRAGAQDWLSVADTGLRCARQTGDRQIEGRMLRSVGSALVTVNRFSEAATNLLRALDIARESGNRRDEASSLGNLAAVYTMTGEHERSAACGAAAATAFRDVGDSRSEAGALISATSALYELGRKTEVHEAMERAVALSRLPGNEVYLGLALTRTAHFRRLYDDPDRAATESTYRAGLDALRAIGNQRHEIEALFGLGALLAQTEERADESAEILVACQRLADELGLPLNEQSLLGVPLDAQSRAILRAVEARAIGGAPR